MVCVNSVVSSVTHCESVKLCNRKLDKSEGQQSTSIPLPYPSAQITPAPTAYWVYLPIGSGLWAVYCFSLITGKNCRICHFWHHVFHRKRSVLIQISLWVANDHQKQQVLLSDHHILFLDQPGKIYWGYIFGEIPRWLSPWLSLLVEAELSSCSPHAFKGQIVQTPLLRKLSFPFCPWPAFEKGESSLWADQLNFPVRGWDQILPCLVIPRSFASRMERYSHASLSKRTASQTTLEPQLIWVT